MCGLHCGPCDSSMDDAPQVCLRNRGGSLVPSFLSSKGCVASCAITGHSWTWPGLLICIKLQSSLIASNATTTNQKNVLVFTEKERGYGTPLPAWPYPSLPAPRHKGLLGESGFPVGSNNTKENYDLWRKDFKNAYWLCFILHDL